jgi:hypothetical protein
MSGLGAGAPLALVQRLKPQVLYHPRQQLRSASEGCAGMPFLTSRHGRFCGPDRKDCEMNDGSGRACPRIRSGAGGGS